MDLNLNLKNQEAVIPKKIGTENSNDSIASVFYPWQERRNIIRRLIVSTSETGRTITAAGFYLCMMSVMLLTSGVGLIAASVWTLIYRIPYIYLSAGSFFLGIESFTLVAGVLSLLCCWITWICHNNKKYYTILPVLMVLLSFSISILATGLATAFVNKAKENFDVSHEPPKLIGHYRTILKETMTYALMNYDTDWKLRWSWDTLQKQLGCCGVEKPKDWLDYRKQFPNSCYINNDKFPFQTVFVYGCMDFLALELLWELCLLIGLSFITLGVKITTLILVTSIYLHDRVFGRNSNNS